MKQQQLWPPLLIVLISSIPAPAENTGRTNEATVAYLKPTISWESLNRSEDLTERFCQEVADSDSIVFDRVAGPASQLAQARTANALGYASLDAINRTGLSLFRVIGSDSLRTAALAALPLGRWADYWQGPLTDLLIGTLGNPEEEHIEITSSSYSAVRSSWERANENAGFQWGVRPWRTSPYVYFLAQAGRMEGRRLITFEGRGGYTMFGSTRLEARLTLQLPARFRLAAGGSVDPTRMSSDSSDSTHFAVTLERLLRSKVFGSDGIFYVGFRSGPNGGFSNAGHENLVVAGLSRSW
jgi:hypothetical protein